MPTFDRQAALAAGMTPEQIDAYLASPQAQQDSAGASGANPRQAAQGGGENPLAGILAGAGEALGGLRGIGIGAGGLGAALLGRRLLSGKKAAPAPVKNPRSASRASSSLVKLTKADIKEHPEFSKFKPGQEVRRATYEKVKMAPTPRKENPRIVAQQEARVEATQGMKPRTRGGRIVGEPKAEIPTRPITVEGEPKRAPAQTTNPRYTGGRGASGPELARRAADRQAFLEGRPPYGPRPQLSAEEAAALRTAPVADPELWMKRGISAPPGKFAGLRGIAPGALQVLLTLLDAQSMPQQIDQSSQLFQDEILKTNPYAQGYREGKYFTRRGGI